MARDDLPEDILVFIDTCIDSIEQLRVLLLLFSQSDRSWTVAEITAELRSAASSIAMRLEDLYSRKVLIRLPELGERHKFSPASPEILQIVGRVAELQQTRPYWLIDAIYSQAPRAVRDFADAFKFKGRKP